MSPNALRHSKALEGLHGVQVFPHSQSALEEINQQGDFQSSHDKSFITANQPLLMQVWQQRPACLRPVRCCMQESCGDSCQCVDITPLYCSWDPGP